MKRPPNHENATEFKTNCGLQPLNNENLPKYTEPIAVRHNENNLQAVSNLMKGLMSRPNQELFKFNDDPIISTPGNHCRSN